MFEAGIEIEAVPGDPVGVDLGYDFYQSLYAEDDVDPLDLRLHLPWLMLSTEAAEVDLTFSWRATFANLGRNDYFQTQQIGPTAGYLVGDAFYLSGGYDYQNRDFKRSHPLVTATSDRSAHRHSIHLTASWLPQEFPVSLRGTFLYRNEDATKNHAFDYEAVGFRIGGGWTLPLRALGHGSPELQVRVVHEARTFDGSSRVLTRSGVRRDDRTDLTVALEVPLYPVLFGRLAYDHLTSDSNDPAADYRSNGVRLILEMRI